MEVVPHKGARLCPCRVAVRKQRNGQKAVEFTPPRWSWLTGGIESMQANPQVIQKMERIKIEPESGEVQTAFDFLAKIKSHSDKSFFLSGNPGTYKTTLGYALLQESARERGALACGGTFGRVIRSMREFEFPKDETPQINEQIGFYSVKQFERRDMKVCLLLDEIEEFPLTEYSMRVFYEIINGAMEFGHQIIITSNAKMKSFFDDLMRRDALNNHQAQAIKYVEKLTRRLEENFLQIDLCLRK